MFQRQAQQKDQHDMHARPRKFQLGSKVMVKGRRPGLASWIPGKITQKSGPLTYVVDVQGGRAWKCHIDQLKECLETDASTQVSEQMGLVNDDGSDSDAETYDVEPPQEDPAVTVSENVSVSENAPVELGETITEATNDTGRTTAVDSATEPTPSTSHKYPLRDRNKHRRFN